MGTKLDPETVGLLLVLAHTALYNALHIMMSLAPSVAVLKGAMVTGVKGDIANHGNCYVTYVRYLSGKRLNTYHYILGEVATE